MPVAMAMTLMAPDFDVDTCIKLAQGVELHFHEMDGTTLDVQSTDTGHIETLTVN